MRTVRIGFFSAVLVSMTALVGAVMAAELLGPAMTMGNGTARLDARLDADRRPIAFGMIMDPGALQGLPAIRNRTSCCYDLDGNGKINDQGECEGDTEIRLALPAAKKAAAESD